MTDSDAARSVGQMQEMLALLPRATEALRRYPNVEHVTVGAKEVRGIATPRAAFQVYVRVKKPDVSLPPDERIPDEILGFPTDVILMPTVRLMADTTTYRPLCGGSQVSQTGGSGTLGVIAVSTGAGEAPVGVPVILTNHHVAPKKGALIGQPSTPSDCWCCACCDVGRVVDTRDDPLFDAAIATLNAGVRYTHEIIDLGVVRGRVSATTLPASAPLAMRGRTSETSRGLFSTASAPPFKPEGSTQTFTNQIRITPVAAGPPFSKQGDSGSVVLDGSNQVVGLLFAGDDPPLNGYANRIENVTAAMHISIPVVGTAGAIPLYAPDLGHRDELTERLTALAHRHGSTEAGRYWHALIDRHREEVLRLVRHHRPATLAWQRHHGPAFVSHYLKTVKDDGYAAPDEIAGMRIENLVLGMAAALRRDGSAALSADVARHYLEILAAAREARRVDALLERLTAQRWATRANGRE